MLLLVKLWVSECFVIVVCLKYMYQVLVKFFGIIFCVTNIQVKDQEGFNNVIDFRQVGICEICIQDVWEVSVIIQSEIEELGEVDQVVQYFGNKEIRQ